MKRLLIFSMLFIISFSGTAQTLEHQYTGDFGQIYQVSPDEFVYGIYDDTLNQFRVYSLDHNLIKSFDLIPNYTENYTFYNLSRTLFNSDQNLELLYRWEHSFYNTWGVKILNDQGTVIFSKDSVSSAGLFNTSQGAKMLLTYKNWYWAPNHMVDVYSLFGTVMESAEIGSSQKTNLFPNPASTSIEINFSELQNEKELKLSIFSISGQLLKQINIPPQQEHISFDVSQFSSGVYLYKISNETFSTDTKKFIVK